MNAPTTPMMMSPIIPPGPSPGTTYFARNPAIRPTIKKYRMPMMSSVPSHWPRSRRPRRDCDEKPSREQFGQNSARAARPLRFRVMKSICLAAVGFALAVSASPALAQTPAPARPAARVEVSGQGSVDRMPDQALVTFSIVTNDDVATRATSANNATYKALVARLHGLGIEAAAVKTTGYYLSYNQRPAQPNPQFGQRYGYVVTRSISVTSDRTDQAGPIVDAGVLAGVTNVGGISFGLRDRPAAYRAALAAAVADAAAQAEAIAAAAHLRLVRVLAIGAASNAPAPRVFAPLARTLAAPAPVPTDVLPSDLTVRASVTVTYEVAP